MGVFKSTVKAVKAADRAMDKAAARACREKAIASTSHPSDQCIGCGRRVKPNGSGVAHCNRTACVRKAAHHF
jgi:hypothetical protein